MYKEKLIKKVLFRDVQSTDKNNNNTVGKPRNNKDGKKRDSKGVVKQR